MTSALLRNETAESPYEAFYYHCDGGLSAVRSGRWELHVNRAGEPGKELYDLQNNIGETENLYEQHPGIVEKLNAFLDTCREDLGDTYTQTEGKNRRQAGHVDNPEALTSFDTFDPYLRAMYDLDETE